MHVKTFENPIDAEWATAIVPRLSMRDVRVLMQEVPELLVFGREWMDRLEDMKRGGGSLYGREQLVEDRTPSLLTLTLGPDNTHSWFHENWTIKMSTRAVDEHGNVWHVAQREDFEDGPYLGFEFGPNFIDTRYVDLQFELNLVWVNVTHTTRDYGGPEEGGWWYDGESLLHSESCLTDDADAVVEDLREKYEGQDDPQPIHNVNSGGRVNITVDDYQFTPSPRPRYG